MACRRRPALGIPKLFLVVTLPTGDHGTDLLTGSVASHARELCFVRERRFLSRPAPKRGAPTPDAADAFLRQLGVTVKGAEE